MDFSCEYNAPQFVDFNSINSEDDSLVEKYFEIDHEGKSSPRIDPMSQVDAEKDMKSLSIKVPMIVLTPPPSEEEEAPKRKPSVLVRWAPKNFQSKRMMSISKKMSKDSSDKRDLTKNMTQGDIDTNEESEIKEKSGNSRRSSGGGKVGFISSKVVKYSRRSSSGGTGGNNNGGGSTIGNCLKKVLKRTDKQSAKPIKTVSSVSSSRISKMIQSYQDKKLISSSKDRKMMHGRSSEMFSRPNRDSSVGVREASDRSSSAYVPMAELIMKMENQVPDRYRTLPSRGRLAAVERRSSLPRSRSNSSVPRVTTCKSPRLLTKTRQYTRSSHETLPADKPSKKPKKVKSTESMDRQLSGSSIGTKAKSAITTVQPFSFDQRIAEAEARKVNRFKEILEKEKQEREFKATSAPNFKKPINLPIREFICPTVIEPFRLDSESRIEARMKKREENTKLEEKKLREMSHFKARPVKSGPVFNPIPSCKAPVEIVAFELHSDRRAQEREAYEQRKKEKEMEIMEQEKKIAERKKQEGLEEIRRRRQETIVKSNPVPHFPLPKILPSSKPITISKSPKLSTKERHY